MKTNLPLISVIVPIYNAQMYLEETIDSVLRQTYKNIEIILVNHASDDNSLEIIKNYAKNDQRIIIINLDVNMGGPAHPRNEGIKRSSGEYIAFVDSDDVWLDNKLEVQLNTLIKMNVDIVHSGAYIINGQSKIVGLMNNQRIRNVFKLFSKDEQIIYISNFININSVLMKKDKELYFNENKEFIAIEDWAFWMEAFEKRKTFLYIKDPLIKYRVHENALSNRFSDITYRKSIVLLSEKMLKNKNISTFIVFLGMQKFFLLIFSKFLKSMFKTK